MLHALTGCTRPVFARLLKVGRHRHSGAGRPRQYAEWVALLVTLMKLRHNLPYQVIEMLTGVDAVTASRMVRRTLIKLADIRLITKRGKVSFYIVDATVTRVGTRDRACYSGHKHYKGLRTQILCDDRKRIHHISPAYPASAHDKTIWNRHVQELKLIPHCRILADKAYAGAKMENIRLFRPVRRHERAYRENKAKAKTENRALTKKRTARGQTTVVRNEIRGYLPRLDFNGIGFALREEDIPAHDHTLGQRITWGLELMPPRALFNTPLRLKRAVTVHEHIQHSLKRHENLTHQYSYRADWPLGLILHAIVETFNTFGDKNERAAMRQMLAERFAEFDTDGRKEQPQQTKEE